MVKESEIKKRRTMGNPEAKRIPRNIMKTYFRVFYIVELLQESKLIFRKQVKA